ncbi:MAG: stage 0 sporulation family protein [Clostridiales bacterium]|nr:stage 0 sporulation family protein [Clostridiales bacterium]MDD6539482.1 stage 0 sporulation family protein [Bacillota bacterium]MDD7016598.1 stage 0 sporulation family protein [Bacillota bacterium]MDY4959100.1 stage 0 sporulation family protein [Lentihominibacter sp.]
MTKVVGVKFKDAGKLYYFSPGNIDVKTGDNVIVETARGLEFGNVTMGITDIKESELVAPLKNIIRIATRKDVEKHKENLAKRDEALRICQEKVDAHKIEMKLIDVEYTFDNSKVVFYFTADGRVDFRELVKDLASVFRMRIELRQIGVRDEAKMLGGVGTCGRGLCCNTWLRDFEPVSIKMAKVQNLSLNPSKISGMCGRLMCCLKFENEAYNYLKKGMPSVGERIKTPDGKALVTEVNILENIVKTRLILEEGDKKKGIEEKLSNEYYSYAKEEIKRLGKHKSGGGKHDDDLSNLDKDTLKEIEKLMKD